MNILPDICQLGRVEAQSQYLMESFTESLCVECPPLLSTLHGIHHSETVHLPSPEHKPQVPAGQ